MARKTQLAQSNDYGWHNQNLAQSIERLHRGQSYRDLSTVWVTITRGSLKPKVVSNWMSLMKPMNQKFFGPVFIENEEVGIGYQKAFEMILDNPELSKWKYIVTIEEDNLLPSDGLLKLYKSIGDYDCVAGLYWTKSNSTSDSYSQPMIYGNPAVMPRDFVPQVPVPNSVQHCNGLGMGANLWKIDTFKTKLAKMERPWFRTVQEPGKGFSQDLWFFNEAAKFGFKCGCDTSVLVGHLDVATGMVW